MLARFEVLEGDCIGCALCPERAPENLEMAAQPPVARAVAQPANEDQVLACVEASEYCPIGALCVINRESSNEYPHAEALAAVPSS